MQSHERYELIEPIARGDFATVYRAQDLELAREVAVKQIHEQYLADPRQLDRYWQEAQLLASLEHPHIMTIYDVVRDRGWLILELMQGSLSQMLGGNPIDLKDLRLTLNYTLHALQFMHDHGIVHGDIKPSNLMVDRNHRVKIGDFGIARRIQGDDGSVVKGTTKYIAPEVVSPDQFGPVGPHSDLYSLGFTAYELMCGEHFETLFPGLNMYGRDRQIAWMMWHSTDDQRLPEIQRVLEGVPDDLTHIIQKLTEKHPRNRYRTADEALADLTLDGTDAPAGPTPEELEAQAQQTKKARRKRSLTIAAFACSVVLSIGVLLLPGKNESPPAGPPVVLPKSGTVMEVDLDRNRFFIQTPDGGSAKSIDVEDELDRFFVNGERATLAALQKGDQVEIAYLKRDDVEFLEVSATRELAVQEAGIISSLNPRIRELEVAVGGDANKRLKVFASEVVAITLNGLGVEDGRKIELADLKPQDRVILKHQPDDEGIRKAIAIDALRDVTATGFVVRAADGELTIRLAPQWDASNPKDVTLPLANDCVTTLNGQTNEAGRRFTVYDLRARDTVSVRHDGTLHRIDAFRDVTETGVIANINYGKQSFTIDVEDGASSSFTTAPQCRIELESSSTPLDFYFLRKGDRITVQRKSPDPAVRDVVLVSVDPQPDTRAWGIVIGHDEYDNPRLPEISFAAADAEAVNEVLRVQYRIPLAQMLFERNGTRVRLENSLAPFLSKIPPESQLIVYFIGHGYLESDGSAYLVPQGFEERRAGTSGLRLDWLVTQLEECPARDKLLLLDTSHESDDRLPDRYPSATELAESLKRGPTRPVSTSVAVIAASESGQLGLQHPDQGRGQFGYVASKGLEGAADTNNDHRVDAVELFRYAEAELAKLAEPDGRRQTPVLYLPDATPPRLTKDAQDAILDILVNLRGRFDRAAVDAQFAAASEVASEQPEPGLAYGLVQLRHGLTLGSERALEQVRLQHPDALLAYHALAWLYFRRGDYRDGIQNLEQLMNRIPADANEDERRYFDHVISLAGKLAGYAVNAAPAERRLRRSDIDALNDAVRKLGDSAMQRYAAGFREVYERTQKIDRTLNETTNEQQRQQLQRERSRFASYLPEFDFEAARRFLIAQVRE